MLYIKITRHYTITRNTKSPAVARIADRTRCHWPSRSSKVDDYHLIWKGMCHFLILVISSNLGSISHRFRDMNTKISKLSTKNCCKIAADGDMVTINSLYRKLQTLYLMVQTPTPYDLPFSHNTARLAYHSVSKVYDLRVIRSQYATSY